MSRKEGRNKCRGYLKILEMHRGNGRGTLRNAHTFLGGQMFMGKVAWSADKMAQQGAHGRPRDFPKRR